MTDIFTKEKRSYVMSRIRGKNTKIDLKIKKILEGMGFPFEMYPRMFGNPDFIFKENKVAIFCDGDFWHGYNYKRKVPTQKFWQEKIERNMRRDRRVTRNLRREGWTVIRIWEHDIDKNMGKCIDKILSGLMK